MCLFATGSSCLLVFLALSACDCDEERFSLGCDCIEDHSCLAQNFVRQYILQIDIEARKARVVFVQDLYFFHCTVASFDLCMTESCNGPIRVARTYNSVCAGLRILLNMRCFHRARKFLLTGATLYPAGEDAICKG